MGIDKNYAEVLESYMIPAVEMKTMDKVAIGAGIVVAANYIGNRIKAKKDAKKPSNVLKEKIKTGNGELTSYGSYSYNVFMAYYNGIIEVEEPKDLTRYLDRYQKVLNYVKVIDNIRNDFLKTNPNKDNGKYSAYLQKFKSIYAQLSKNELDEKINSSDMHSSPFKQSNIYKIFNKN